MKKQFVYEFLQESLKEYLLKPQNKIVGDFLQESLKKFLEAFLRKISNGVPEEISYGIHGEFRGGITVWTPAEILGIISEKKRDFFKNPWKFLKFLKFWSLEVSEGIHAEFSKSIPRSLTEEISEVLFEKNFGRFYKEILWESSNKSFKEIHERISERFFKESQEEFLKDLREEFQKGSKEYFIPGEISEETHIAKLNGPN